MNSVNWKLSFYNVVRPYKKGIALFNTKSRGLLVLNHEYFKKYTEISRGNFTNSDDLIAELIHGEMLVHKDLDEVNRIMSESYKARFSDKTLQITIAPTTACNFACPYCFEKNTTKEVISNSTIERVITFISSYYGKIHHLIINWYGGEPLLNLNAIKQITSKINETLPSDCSYEASIITNGYFLSKRTAKILQDLNVSSAQITLDGSAKSHDARRVPLDKSPTYDHIIANIMAASDYIDIFVRANIDKNNLSDMKELLLNLKDKGLNEKILIYLALVDNSGDLYLSNCTYLTAKEFAGPEIEFYKNAILMGFQIDLFGSFSRSICSAVCKNSFVIDPLRKRFVKYLLYLWTLFL